MKKLVLGTAAVLTIGAALIMSPVNQAEAGLFNSLKTSGWDTVESVFYMVETNGFNVRVYEWPSQTDEDTTCMMAFTDTGAVGLQCWKNPQTDSTD